MKNNVGKIILKISFIPYILVIIYGIICAISGVSFFYSTVYGGSGFFAGILVGLYCLVLLIPIIPICLIYEICYLFRKLFKKVKLGKYVSVCLIIGIVIIGVILMHTYSTNIRMFVEKIQATQMIKNAEEKIAINKNSYYNASGVLNIKGYNCNYIFVDYDNNEVGMLIGGGIDSFWKVKLNKTTKGSNEYKHIINDYYMQSDIPLSSPGKRLISFYDNDIYSHRTIAFILVYADGSIYFADKIKEDNHDLPKYSDLNSGDYSVDENVKYYEK